MEEEEGCLEERWESRGEDGTELGGGDFSGGRGGSRQPWAGGTSM